MTLYVDSSALSKRYLREPLSDASERLLLSDQDWTTARHTAVEVRRTLTLNLDGAELAEARRLFSRDWALTKVIELTEAVCEAAAQIAEVTRIRTLDALHLGAARLVGAGQLPFVTYDVRQAQAARSLGWTVLGL